MLKRITIPKRMRAKLHEVKDQLHRGRHRPVPEQGRWLASVVRGHLAYYAVPGNIKAAEGVPRPGDPTLGSRRYGAAASATARTGSA